MPLPRQVRNAHPYFMYDEIQAQPDAIAAAVDAAQGAASAFVTPLRASARVLVLGNGTSYHAAQVGATLLEPALPRLWVEARQSFEFVTYGPRGESARHAADTVFVVSHAGETHMALRAIEQARADGACTIAVTGFPESSVARAADAVLPTGYCAELSWAHTVSYTAAIASFAAFALALAGAGSLAELEDALARMPDMLRQTLDLEPQIRALARQMAGARSFWFTGAGPNAVTASEAALKMLETNHTMSSGYELEQMLHGYLAGADARDVLWLIIPSGPEMARAHDVVRAAREIGISCVAQVDSSDHDLGPDVVPLVLPSTADALSPILHVVPLQLFSYYLTLERGLNPDLLRRDQPAYLRARESYV